MGYANAGDILESYMRGSNFVRENLDAAEKARKERQVAAVRRVAAMVRDYNTPTFGPDGKLHYPNQRQLLNDPKFIEAINGEDMEPFRRWGLNNPDVAEVKYRGTQTSPQGADVPMFEHIKKDGGLLSFGPLTEGRSTDDNAPVQELHPGDPLHMLAAYAYELDPTVGEKMIQEHKAQAGSLLAHAYANATTPEQKNSITQEAASQGFDPKTIITSAAPETRTHDPITGLTTVHHSDGSESYEQTTEAKTLHDALVKRQLDEKLAQDEAVAEAAWKRHRAQFEENLRLERRRQYELGMTGHQVSQDSAYPDLVAGATAKIKANPLLTQVGLQEGATADAVANQSLSGAIERAGKTTEAAEQMKQKLNLERADAQAKALAAAKDGNYDLAHQILAPYEPDSTVRDKLFAQNRADTKLVPTLKDALLSGDPASAQRTVSGLFPFASPEVKTQTEQVLLGALGSNNPAAQSVAQTVLPMVTGKPLTLGDGSKAAAKPPEFSSGEAGKPELAVDHRDFDALGERAAKFFGNPGTPLFRSQVQAAVAAAKDLTDVDPQVVNPHDAMLVLQQTRNNAKLYQAGPQEFYQNFAVPIQTMLKKAGHQLPDFGAAPVYNDALALKNEGLSTSTANKVAVAMATNPDVYNHLLAKARTAASISAGLGAATAPELTLAPQAEHELVLKYVAEHPDEALPTAPKQPFAADLHPLGLQPYGPNWRPIGMSKTPPFVVNPY